MGEVILQKNFSKSGILFSKTPVPPKLDELLQKEKEEIETIMKKVRKIKKIKLKKGVVAKKFSDLTVCPTDYGLPKQNLKTVWLNLKRIITG